MSDVPVDYVRFKQDDGSIWHLLPNLELRLVKPASRRGRKPKAAPVDMTTTDSLF